MKINGTIYVWLVLIICWIPGCARRDMLYQTSTIDALLAGVYDGRVECRDLLKHGDMGIGTFNRLDGEMAILDGVVYQVRSDGKVYRPGKDERTPFAAVTHFEVDRTVRNRRMLSYEKMIEQLDGQLESENIPVAIRIDGYFPYMKVRSVPAQSEPYPPLAEVAKTQPVFEYRNVKGTLLGFRLPEFMKGVNVTGYHLHFLSEDRTQGGHLLDCTVGQATAQLDFTNEVFLSLPTEGGFGSVDLAKDRESELQQVEKGTE